MTTTGVNPSQATIAASTDADELPWYELINEAPEPPEDAMQQADTIIEIMSALFARYGDAPDVLVSKRTNLIYDSDTPGSVVVPDGYVVFGVDSKAIEVYDRSYRVMGCATGVCA